MHSLDVILTSCGRHDLLEVTLASFFEHFDGKVNNFYIYEDYGYSNMSTTMKDNIVKLRDKYPTVEWIIPNKKTGQITALDTLWGKCTTQYVFQMEDDWLFYDTGFVSASIEKLHHNPKVVMYWIRDRADTNGHPISKDGILSTHGRWKGYSFNPSVKRLSDYRLLGKFGRHTKFNPKDPSHSEWVIGTKYFQRGFVAGILDKGYIKHLGYGRTVR